MDAGEVPPATIAEVLRTLTLLLAPFAPFLAAELWEQLWRRGRCLPHGVADCGCSIWHGKTRLRFRCR